MRGGRGRGWSICRPSCRCGRNSRSRYYHRRFGRFQIAESETSREAVRCDQRMRGRDRRRSRGGGRSGSAEYLLGGNGARRRAVEALPLRPAHVLVDGKRWIAGCRVSQTAVIDGDALSASVAAASIVAKVTRDSIMEEYAQFYPGYGFERHKGYGTADHISALTRLGSLPLHRWSFAPVWRVSRSQPQLALWRARDKAGTD